MCCGWCINASVWRLVYLVILLPASVDASGLAVLYPNVKAPYVRVFDNIVLGVKKSHKQDVEVYMLPEKINAKELERWLREKRLINIVALGNQAMNLALALPASFRVVAGAVLSAPVTEGRAFSAITMAPDPDLLFDQLIELSPAIESVSVVYQSGRHDALIDRAREVAASHGVVVVAHGTDNAREGANLFKTIIDDHAPEKTAIWLLQGVPALKERSVLQSVLRKAWDQKIVVFSSNPSYVKRGALFSLYPNNFELGQSLAAASLDLAKGLNLGTRPSRELDSVLNTRTAEHLGLGLSRSRKRQFDILFPSE